MRKHALSNTKSQQVRDYEEERANNAHLAEGCERWMTVVMTDRGNSSVARLLYIVGAYHFIECFSVDYSWERRLHDPKFGRSIANTISIVLASFLLFLRFNTLTRKANAMASITGQSFPEYEWAVP